MCYSSTPNMSFFHTKQYLCFHDALCAVWRRSSYRQSLKNCAAPAPLSRCRKNGRGEVGFCSRNHATPSKSSATKRIKAAADEDSARPKIGRAEHTAARQRVYDEGNTRRSRKIQVRSRESKQHASLACRAGCNHCPEAPLRRCRSLRS